VETSTTYVASGGGTSICFHNLSTFEVDGLAKKGKEDEDEE
jgi:hypothetical protein